MTGVVVATVRGVTGKRDGHIHTDTKSKFVTLLLYLNSGWQPEGAHLHGADCRFRFAQWGGPRFGAF
jgi:hypothetical protein